LIKRVKSFLLFNTLPHLVMCAATANARIQLFCPDKLLARARVVDAPLALFCSFAL
jgi:hypothetical protein